MINGRSRSILLQVAFKEAATSGADVSEVRTLTASFYNMLIDLHAELNIDPEDGAFKSKGGGNSGWNKGPSAPAPQGETFMFNGILVEDFRTAKAAPGSTVKANYPDFKTATGDEIAGITNPKGAAWLYLQDGSPNENVKELVTAADTKVF